MSLGGRTDGRLPVQVGKDGAKWLFVPAKVYMEFISCWPLNRTFISDCVCLLLAIVSATTTLGNLNMILHSGGNMTAIVHGLLNLITLLETLGRRVMLLFGSRKLGKLFTMIIEDFWPSDIAGEEARNQVNARSVFLFKVWALYTVIGTTSMLVPIVLALQLGMKPMATYYPYPLETTPYFEILYVMESYCSADQPFIIAGVDLFIFSIIFNCSAQFILLSEYFRKNLDRITKIEDVNERAQEARKLITSCIRHHNILLRSCQELNSITKVFVLWRILTGSVAICVTAFMIRFQPDDLIQGCFYFVAIMMECFVYCYVGNEVVLASADFSDVVFTAGWHLLNLPQNVDVQKMMSFMILRAQRPVKMTVGDFGYLGLEFYMKMVKFSFSIYTVMGKSYNK